MKQKEVMVMPSSYAVMTEEEMCYLEGGINLTMSRDYLDKDYCEEVAQSYIDSGWTNVTTEQLKKEIYGHAYAYYNMTPAIVILGGVLGSTIWMNKFFPSLKNGIDIEDKVDRYQSAWNVLWNF